MAYYSRADENYFGGIKKYIEVGNTEKVAIMIADMTGDDLYKINQMHPYSADYDTCIKEAKDDLRSNTRPELKNMLKSIDEYDEIYLGYPNYWGTMPMAVYTFLESFNWSGKKVYPFCTHEGSGLSSTESDIKKYAEVMKGFAIRGSDVDTSQNKIKEWVEKSRTRSSTFLHAFYQMHLEYLILIGILQLFF